jgi:hypothetical protein
MMMSNKENGRVSVVVAMIYGLNHVVTLRDFFARSLLNVSNVMPRYEATYLSGMRFSSSGRELMKCWYLAWALGSRAIYTLSSDAA